VRILGGRRDEVQRRLAEAGIGTMVYYPVPLHRLPVYGYPEGSFPEAERAAREVLSLPIWPTLREEKIRQVATGLWSLLT